MKNLALAFSLPILFAPILDAQNGEKLVVEGEYHQENLYVNNPMSEAGVGFCINEVRINGELSSAEVNSSAFEVNFEDEGLNAGDEVVVEIAHKNGCRPKVLNPNVLKPRATFKIQNIEVDSNGILKWKTSNEKGQLPYEVQQFKWNKWVSIGEVQGEGTPGEHEYSFETVPVPGENRFRVKQEGRDDEEKVSPAVEYHSKKDKVSYEYLSKEESIDFSRETSYELYNIYGEMIKKGYGEKVDLSNFEDGTYYLNFGSETKEFEKD